MIYLKKYEKFIESIGFNDNVDGIGYDEATYDHSKNPVLKRKVEAYVEELINSNQYKVLFDILDIDMPKDIDSSEFDDMFEQVKKRAIEFYMKNPHKMIEIDDTNVEATPIDARNTNNDGIPRVSNIGGTSFTM